MIKIKVTKICLNPVFKSEITKVVDNYNDIDNAICEILKEAVTETEPLNVLIRKYNLATIRARVGKSRTIFIYTHPAKGSIVRYIFEVYDAVYKEVGKLL